jgi:hypothetical protein
MVLAALVRESLKISWLGDSKQQGSKKVTRPELNLIGTKVCNKERLEEVL